MPAVLAGANVPESKGQVGWFSLYLTIMKRERREVVVTGVGLCCHMGSDLDRIERELRAGQNTPFQTYEEAVRYGGRCHQQPAYGFSPSQSNGCNCKWIPCFLRLHYATDSAYSQGL